MPQIGTKVVSALKLITVEPTIFLYSFAYCLQMPAEQAFIYHKQCHYIFNDSNICDNLKNNTFKNEEDLVQTESAYWMSYFNFCMMLPTMVMTIIYGIISDKYSRKNIIIIPLFGSVLDNLCFVFMTIWPDLPFQFLLLGKLLVGFAGHWQTLFMETACYIASITNTDQRITRLSIINGQWYIAVSVSFFIGGSLLESTSFRFIFALSGVVNILAILYTVIFIREVSLSSSEEHHKERGSEVYNLFKTLKITCIDLRDGFKNLVRKRPKNNRQHLLVIFPMIFFIMTGLNRKFVFNIILLGLLHIALPLTSG